jgi:phosphatidylglycerol---prolipoprotein diacylglyceryl transferase
LLVVVTAHHRLILSSVTIHFTFEVLAYLAAVVVYTWQRRRGGDPIDDRTRATVVMAAAVGAAIGTRLLAWLSYPSMPFFAGKTIVGGLLGALIAVEVTKRLIGVRRSTGDPFVLPLIIAIAIGRIGCFLAGPADRTAGKPTSLPWGVAMGDAVRRHPVALYEIAFVLLIAPWVLKRRDVEGDAFKLFLLSYLTFRFFVDFLKPDPPPVVAGISAIQWACLAGILYYAVIFICRTLPGRTSTTTP